MSGRKFPTAQDAENAFYEALERGDLEGMMAVWAEDEDIVCVHPAGPRLTGHDQIRESWARVFSAGPRARVHITSQVAISGMMLAVHSVHENFTIQGQARSDAPQPVPIVATNIYLRTAAGWRMIVHHASPALDWILRRFDHQVDAIGVSLGGNVLLKWLGERAGEATAIVRRAAAVSAPLDLAAAGAALDRGLNRLLYTRMFLSTLKPKSLAQLDRFPGLFDRTKLAASTTFREFDNLYTAPMHGFRDVDHYWTSSSSGPWLERIAVPTLVLNARNDPFLPEAALVAASRKVSTSVLLEFPRTGGHVGFRGPWLAQRL